MKKILGRIAVAAALAAMFVPPNPARAEGEPAGPTKATAPGQLPELWRRIAQREDPARREAALAETMRLLREGDSQQRDHAMEALAETTSVPFDRAPFLPLVRKGLADEDAGVRAFALRILKAFGGTMEEDMPAVVARTKDVERHVRAWVAFALYQLDPAGAHPGIEPAVLALLADPEWIVVKETCRALWGMPTGEAVDARLVELSRDPEKTYDVVYFALSTRTAMRCIVAERLMEVAGDGTLNDHLRGRAAWGLAHATIDPGCRNAAVDAMISWLANDLDREVRRNAVWGLGNIGTPKAIEALKKVESSDEDEGLRGDANRALLRFGATPRESAE